MKRIPKYKWIKALVDNYRQGKNYLKQKNIGDEEYRFSPLGVLEDVYIEHVDNKTPEDEETPLAMWHEHTNEEGITYWDRCNGNNKLNASTAKWAQIPCNPGLSIVIKGVAVVAPISVLNDDYNFSFKDFAQAIKDQL